MKKLGWVITIMLIGCASVRIENITRSDQPIGKIETLRIQVEQGIASVKLAKNFREIIVDELQKDGFRVEDTSDVSLILTIEDIQLAPASGGR